MSGPPASDKGKGGKYLITPPDYKDKAPDGYIHLPSQTYQGYALLRSILKSRDDADIAKAVEYGKRIKLYPLSAAAKPPETTFVDGVGVVVDGTIPYDVRFFQSLDRMVQIEPWIERDRAMIDPLKSLGIEKGKPFKPDGKTTEILKSAAEEALALFDLRYETSYEPHNEGKRWFLPADKRPDGIGRNGFSKTEIYPTDKRGMLFYFAYTTVKHLGAGQFYLFVSRDKDGNPLDGAATYRLTCRPSRPCKQYWSAVLYDFATHALIRNMPHASRSSQSPGLQTNADGSVDVYFAPKAPAGKESNWFRPTPRADSKRSSVSTARKAAVREDLGAAGHREDRLSTRKEKRSWLHKQKQLQHPKQFRSPLKTSCGLRPTLTSKSTRPARGVNWARSCSAVTCRRWTTRRSFARTATRFMRAAVFDLDAGPVTITLPDPGGRFMSMQTWNEDQYTPGVKYNAGSYKLTKEDVGITLRSRGFSDSRQFE